MAILESVRELASKLGADTNGRTIADQINIINQHLEADTANDIAGAIKEYSKKAGSGGGGGETFEVNVTMSGQGVITVDKTYSEIKAAIDNNKVIVGDVNFADLLHVNIGCGCVSDIIKNGVTQTTDAVILTTEVYIQSFGSSPESTQDIFVIKSDDTYEMIENGIYY